MSLIRPFRGLRPPTELAERISAPPYDVVNRREAFTFARGNPRSFFHISRPEIDLGLDIDEHDDRVHARGCENLATFVREGWLIQDDGPHFYLYRQTMGSHTQIGVVAVASVDEYDAGLIKRHEHTRPDKEDDRTRHIDALGANDEPVFLTYRARSDIDALVNALRARAPDVDFESDLGSPGAIHHALWVVPQAEGERLSDAFAALDCLYIADGHHRSAAASRVHALRKERRAPLLAGTFLVVIFPDRELKILPYNRVVRDLAGYSRESFLGAVAERFEIREGAGASPAHKHHFGMFLGERWVELIARDGSFEPGRVASLDVSILQNNLLGPLLGVLEPRTNSRIQFVGGVRGTGELERRVTSGENAVAFSLFATELNELMAIADEGEIMPPKSTWFEPKLRSGLFLHRFED